MIIHEIKELNIPKQSGVYFFRKGRKILYIGKATSLADRVKSYFAKDVIATRGAHIVDMVFQADALTWETTDSALEALILEAALIKKYQPYYNTKEKDDKSYLCICITDEEWPMVIPVRMKDIDQKAMTAKVERGTKACICSHIFGPFTNGTAVREALTIVRRIFPFRDLSSSKKDNYEFYRQLGLSPATPGVILNSFQDLKIPDQVRNDTIQEYKTALKEYQKNIKHIVLFFEGKKKQIVKELNREMMDLAKKERFEDATQIKKKIFSLEHINDIALLKKDIWNREYKTGAFRIEAYDIAHLSGKQMVGVMTVFENGTANKSEYRKFIIRGFNSSNDTGALEEVLSRRLRHAEWGMPDLIVLDGSIGQINVAKRVLDRYQLKIPLVAVTKDEHHKAREIKGDEKIYSPWADAVIAANSEAHRFAITFHKQKRRKEFLQ